MTPPNEEPGHYHITVTLHSGAKEYWCLPDWTGVLAVMNFYSRHPTGALNVSVSHLAKRAGALGVAHRCNLARKLEEVPLGV